MRAPDAKKYAAGSWPTSQWPSLFGPESQRLAKVKALLDLPPYAGPLVKALSDAELAACGVKPLRSSGGHTPDLYSDRCTRCTATRYEIEDALAPAECAGDYKWRTAWKDVAALRAELRTAHEHALKLMAQNTTLVEMLAASRPAPEPAVEDQRNAALAKAVTFR